MSMRYWMQKFPKTTAGIAAGLFVMAFVLFVYQLQLSGSGNRQYSSPLKRVYFTVDDGATYFADDINLIPPFEHEGKQAVQACVFKGSTGKPFVVYLLRYTPAAKQKLETIKARPNFDPGTLLAAMGTGTEIKKPLTGDKGWVDSASPAAASVCEIHPPPGVSGGLEPALP